MIQYIRFYVASHIALSLRLRELRGGQSQTNIAQKLGLSYQTYQRLESIKGSWGLCPAERNSGAL